MSGPAYRRELELELERLTKELADVRVEKAQQRQRIEQLQVEQKQLKTQLASKTSTGGETLRSDLTHQIQNLHHVVKQKKQEHTRAKQEWERSQEQHQHLQRTVGLLQGGTGGQYDASGAGDQYPPDAANNRNKGKKTRGGATAPGDGSWVGGGDAGSRNESNGGKGRSNKSRNRIQGQYNTNQGVAGGAPVQYVDGDEAEETDSYNWEDTLGTGASVAASTATEEFSIFDGDSTVVTEHTKDSLQVYRQKRAQRQREQQEEEKASRLDQFLSRTTNNGTTQTVALRGGGNSASGGSGGGADALGAHLERESRTQGRRTFMNGLDEEKDAHSAAE